VGGCDLYYLLFSLLISQLVLSILDGSVGLGPYTKNDLITSKK
jgi:hypothetical protein